MLDSFTRGLWSVKYLWWMGILFILIAMSYYFFIRDKQKSTRLEGELIYDIGRSLLKRSVKLDDAEEVVMSIGPKVLSDTHIMLKKGTSFRFVIKGVVSNSGDRLVNIKCEPPGLIEYKGEIRSEIDLYSGEEFMMNGIPLQYVNGKDFSTGENILKGRM